MVPHPASAIPPGTFIGRGRHLRGSPVKKKTPVKSGNGIVGKAGQHVHAPRGGRERPGLVACFGGLFWWPGLVACFGGLFWWPVLAALLRYQRHPQRVLKYGAKTGQVSSCRQRGRGGLFWRPFLVACFGGLF